jgi:hypothetical protein
VCFTEEQVLTDPVQRAVYDELHGYAATAANPFFDDSAPKDKVFVDEFTCIGNDILLTVPYEQKFLFGSSSEGRYINFILFMPVQDARSVPMSAPMCSKLRTTLGGQESAPRQVART